MELQVGVKVLLKNPQGKYLLLKRSPIKYPEVGPKWDIVGGRINPGSALLDNLKREIKEETSLDLLKPVRLVGAQDILRNPEKHVVRLTYVGEIDGDVRLDEDHSEFSWFSLEEIKKLTQQQLDAYFKELLEKGVFD